MERAETHPTGACEPILRHGLDPAVKSKELLHAIEMSPSHHVELASIRRKRNADSKLSRADWAQASRTDRSRRASVLSLESSLRRQERSRFAWERQEHRLLHQRSLSQKLRRLIFWRLFGSLRFGCCSGRSRTTVSSCSLCRRWLCDNLCTGW